MISKEDIEHLKNLARVEFGKEETEALANDLGDILNYVDELKNADVSNVPEMTSAIGGITARAVTNVFRKDELAARNVEADQYQSIKNLIEAFPEKYNAGHGVYLKVKSVL